MTPHAGTRANWRARVRRLLLPVLFAAFWVFLPVAETRAGEGFPLPPSSSIGGSRLLLPTTLRLEPLSARELIRHVSKAGGAGLGGGSVLLAPGQDPLSVPIALNVVRKVDRLWRLEVGDDQELVDRQVAVDVVSLNGQPGELCAATEGSSALSLRLLPTSVQLVEEAGRRYLEGGVVMDLDLSKVQRPGEYAGTFTVTVTAR